MDENKNELGVMSDDVGNLDDFDMFDDMLDIDLEGDMPSLSEMEHELIDLMAGEELDGEVDTFDGKFFISYLGFNPITLLFETNEEITRIVYPNYDERKLPFLVENLQQFNGSIKYNLNRQREEYVKLKKEGAPLEELQDREIKIDCTSYILRRLQESTSTLKEIYKVMSFEVDNVSKPQKDKTTIVDLVRDNNLVEKVISEAIDNAKDISDTTTSRYNSNKLMTLGGIVQALEALVKNKSDFESGDELEEAINRYKYKMYNYPEGIRNLFDDKRQANKMTELQMMELLQDLKFPTALIKNENLFKTGITHTFDVSSTKMNIDITDSVKKSIFRIFNVYISLQNKVSLGSLYS